MLQQNPDLTWRDVKDILAHTSRKIDPTSSTWQTNGAGLHVSHDFGKLSSALLKHTLHAKHTSLHSCCTHRTRLALTTLMLHSIRSSCTHCTHLTLTAH